MPPNPRKSHSESGLLSPPVASTTNDLLGILHFTRRRIPCHVDELFHPWHKPPSSFTSAHQSLPIEMPTISQKVDSLKDFVMSFWPQQTKRSKQQAR